MDAQEYVRDDPVLTRNLSTPPEDTFNILVATDNHLGFMEKDPVRREDSFRAFEEILKTAHAHNVDCLLLGGDLFHDNKPSRFTLHKTMSLFRQYCLGDKECPLEFESDPSIVFPGDFPMVNYQDPNYNIALPVFAIHGNHDDPSGEGNLSSMNLLSIAGLLNYYGRADVDDVKMHPVLFRKGQSRLSLYGLGNIRDERLFRAFKQNKTEVIVPRTEPGEDPGFNLFFIHQNRYVSKMAVTP